MNIRIGTRQLSPLQIGLSIGIVLLTLGACVHIVRTYWSAATASTAFETASYMTTNLANIQREALLLEVEVGRHLRGLPQSEKNLKLRRTLLQRQLHRLASQGGGGSRLSDALSEIHYTLDQYDALVDPLSNTPTPEQVAAIATQADDLFDNLERQIKSLYDQAEISFFKTFGVALHSQRDAQMLLLGMSGLLLLLGVALVVSLRRTVSAEFEQAYRSLEAEVAERKRAEAQLAHDAVHDALTGLPNRVLLLDRLRHAIELTKRREGYHFSVLFMDLDHFKVVNDSLGHTIGDQLLIGIAQRLRMCVRTGDTVARLGGDEFVILIEDMANGNDAGVTAEGILTALQQPFNLNGHQLFAAASIGIVNAVDGYDQPDDVLRDADIAMYQAKMHGKARSEVFSLTMRAHVQNRLALENDLRQVLERKELELYYQPILALQSDRITGFEALLRWRHPEHGLIAPNEFIPIAEETHQIIPIGQWVLREACRQLREWQVRFPQMPPLTMSINISGVQFTAPNFIDQVTAILEEYDLDPTTLRLELTERVWLNSTAEAVTLFRKLSQMGIQLHIDDFGTGYSSLAYLQHFPIRTLKIDRAFLDKMEEDSNSKDLVRAVIAMAHDLGMEAVAEGVETVEQLNDLKRFGCNYGQGYLLSHPINQAGIEALLQGHHAESAPPLRQAGGVRSGGRGFVAQPAPVS